MFIFTFIHAQYTLYKHIYIYIYTYIKPPVNPNLPMVTL